jgi:hypothetical protein
MTNRFTAQEFEPDGSATEFDGDADTGAGHNRRGKPTEHARVGEALLATIQARGEALCRIPDEKGQTHLWYHQDGLWTLLLEPIVWLEHAIEVTLRVLNKTNKSRVRFITEVRKYIERNPNIRVGGKIGWDNHGKVPTRSGLIDPVTLVIEPFRTGRAKWWLRREIYGRRRSRLFWLSPSA